MLNHWVSIFGCAFWSLYSIKKSFNVDCKITISAKWVCILEDDVRILDRAWFEARVETRGWVEQACWINVWVVWYYSNCLREKSKVLWIILVVLYGDIYYTGINTYIYSTLDFCLFILLRIPCLSYTVSLYWILTSFLWYGPISALGLTLNCKHNVRRDNLAKESSSEFMQISLAEVSRSLTSYYRRLQNHGENE